MPRSSQVTGGRQAGALDVATKCTTNTRIDFETETLTLIRRTAEGFPDGLHADLQTASAVSRFACPTVASTGDTLQSGAFLCFPGERINGCFRRICAIPCRRAAAGFGAKPNFKTGSRPLEIGRC